jgi:hypothetical protein
MADPQGDRERGWRDAEVLDRLYWDEGLDQQAIAERLDCDQGTVSNWMDRHGIRSRHERETHRVERAAFAHNGAGYEVWHDGSETVYVHRLLAVAEYGFEAVAEGVVHHEDGVKWHNCAANLRLFDSHRAHALHHAEDRG